MFYLLYGIAIFFLVFWCIMWLIHLIAIIQAKLKLYKKYGETCIYYPDVSILKPLKGYDPGLYDNLKTFFLLKYPSRFEILFCFEDKDDPALSVVRSLIEEYPDVDVKIFTNPVKVGVNPKINNMQQGYVNAKAGYEFILISDSGIKMKEDTLTDMAQHIKPDIGIVHQMPFICDKDGFAAAFEKVFFGTFHSKIYLFADFLRTNCHTGMSTLIRKSLLDECGGLKAFGCYLAEDYFMAQYILSKGYRLTVSSQPALQNPSSCSIKVFHERMKRWTKLRVAMAPFTIPLEPLSECFIIGLFASWAVNLLFLWDPTCFYLSHVLCWLLLDWTLLKIIQNGPLPFSKYCYLIAWIYHGFTAPYIFVEALISPTVKWRSRYYKLQWGGKTVELSPKIDV